VTGLFVIGPLLYVLYAAAIARATRRHWGPGCFVTIIMFHYSLIMIMVPLLGILDEVSRIRQTWPRHWGAIILAALVFAAIHIGTVIYLIACHREQWRICNARKVLAERARISR
jgi:hypothetical protein